jgi:hypothetical protein
MPAKITDASVFAINSAGPIAPPQSAPHLSRQYAAQFTGGAEVPDAYAKRVTFKSVHAGNVTNTN